MESDKSPFHITIGAYPAKNLTLDQEIKLVKSSILYGDKIKLYSITASVMTMVGGIGDVPTALKFRLLQKVAPHLPIENREGLMKSLQFYEGAIKQKHRSGQILLHIKSFEKQLNSQWGMIKDKAVTMLQEAGMSELTKAIDAGLLSLHNFENTEKAEFAVDYMAECVNSAISAKAPPLSLTINDCETDNMVNEFVNGITSAISDRSTYPLFDYQTSSLVKAGIEANVFCPGKIVLNKGKNIALAAHLFSKLPDFTDLPIEDVINIRAELDKPLTRFRSAIIKYSDCINSAFWDSDFEHEAETTFNKDVAPSILDIEDSIKSNSFLVKTIRALADKPLAVPTGSGLGIALSKFSDLPDVLSQALGIGAAVAPIVYDAYSQWKDKNRQAEQNLLYFYYRVQKLAEH